MSDWDGWFCLAGRCDGGYPAEICAWEIVAFDEPVIDASMLKIIRRGRAQAPATQAALGPTAAMMPKVWTGWGGTEHVLPGPGIGDRLRTRMARPATGRPRRISSKTEVEVAKSMVVGEPPKPDAAAADSEGFIWLITDSSDPFMK